MKTMTIEYDKATVLPETHPMYGMVNISKEGKFIGLIENNLDFEVVKEKVQITMDAIDCMETYGGSFVKALADAWCKADPINKKKLEDNFKYFEEYELQAQRRKQ